MSALYSCMRECKSADLAHFQPAISPCWCKPWLLNTWQAWRVPSATQAWAIRARGMASACVRYLQKFRAGFLPNAASHGWHGFSSLCTRLLLPKHRESVAMLLVHVWEIEATPSYNERRPYSWQCTCVGLGGDREECIPSNIPTLALIDIRLCKVTQRSTVWQWHLTTEDYCHNYCLPL